MGESSVVDKAPEVLKEKKSNLIGTVTVLVYDDKPIEISMEGNLTGQHIPRIKRMLSRSYLAWQKSRRI